jgi:hypothetical protein
MISFAATILYLMLDKKLKENKLSLTKLFDALLLLKAHIFEDRIIPDIATKRTNDICKVLKIQIPKRIDVKEL